MAVTIGGVSIQIGANPDGLYRGLYNAERALKKSAGSFKTIGSQISLSFADILGGLSVGAVLTDAFHTVTKFEQSIADLSAVSGKSAKDMERLTKSAIDIGAKSAFSATQVVELQAELSKLGFSENEILASTQAIGDFSIAVGTTAANAATLAGSVLRSFQLDAEQAGSVMETLAVATIKTALDFEKLSIALPYVGTAAQQMGISIERTTAILGLLSDRGVRAETAGTSLRDILLDSAKSGLTLEDSLKRVSGSQDKLKTATEIFGKTSAAAAVIIASNADELNNLERSITGVDGALKEMSEKRLDTVKGKLELLSGAWESFVLRIDKGDGAISNAVKNTLDILTKYIERLDSTQTSGEKIYRGTVEPFVEAGKAIGRLSVDTAQYFSNLYNGINNIPLKGINRLKDSVAGFGAAIKKNEGTTLKLQEFKFATTTTGKKEDKNKKQEVVKPSAIPLLDIPKLLSTEQFNKEFNKISQAFEDSDIFQGLKNKVELAKETIRTELADKLPKVEIKPLLNSKGLEEGLEEVIDLSKEFEVSVKNSLFDTFTLLGETLGNLLTGDAGFGSFFNGLLAIVADFMTTFGKQVLAIGVAKKGLEKLFLSGGGTAAIAAGIGLIALGKIVKNLISKPPSLDVGTDFVKKDGLAQIHRGEAIIPAAVVAQGGYSGGKGNNNITVTGVLRGQDILLSNRYGQDTSSRYRG